LEHYNTVLKYIFMRLTFKLRPQEDEDKPCQVVAYYTHTSKETPMRLNTYVHCKPEDWDAEKQRIKYDYFKTNPENSKLDAIEKDLKKIIDEYWFANNRGRNYPLPSTLKKLYQKRDIPKEVQQSNLLIPLYDKWVKTLPDQYMGIYGTLRSDLVTVFGNNMILGDVSVEGLSKLRTHWIAQGHNNTTSRKRWTTLRRYLVDQTNKPEKPNPEFLTFQLKLKGTPIDQNIFSLTKEEFKVLYDFDFSGFRPEERYSINLFMLSSFTALRISDVVNVRPDSIKKYRGVDRVRVPIKKNNGKLSIVPVNDVSKEIINNRLDYNVKLTEQNIRDNLKKVLKQMVPYMPDSYTDIETFYKMVGKKPAHSEGPKYSFLTYHSSRKFFATYFLKKVGLTKTMAWGGWSSISTLNRYLDRDDRDGLKQALKKIRI
jgi:integrase